MLEEPSCRALALWTPSSHALRPGARGRSSGVRETRQNGRQKPQVMSRCSRWRDARATWTDPCAELLSFGRAAACMATPSWQAPFKSPSRGVTVHAASWCFRGLLGRLWLLPWFSLLCRPSDRWGGSAQCFLLLLLLLCSLPHAQVWRPGAQRTVTAGSSGPVCRWLLPSPLPHQPRALRLSCLWF